MNATACHGDSAGLYRCTPQGGHPMVGPRNCGASQGLSTGNRPSLQWINFVKIQADRCGHEIHGNLWGIYPLVNIQKTMERSTIFNGKIHYKWPFSIAFCMFTRGYGNYFGNFMLNLSDESELITLDTLASKDSSANGCLAQSRATPLSGASLGPRRPTVAWRVGSTRYHEVLVAVDFCEVCSLDFEPTNKQTNLKFSILLISLTPVFSCSFNWGKELCPKTIENHEGWRWVCLCQHFGVLSLYWVS